MQNCLQEFVRTWSGSWGCRPFIYGLQDVLQHHRDNEKCAEWELTNDIFTQSGGEEFMESAVNLLKVSVHPPPRERTSSHDGSRKGLVWWSGC